MDKVFTCSICDFFKRRPKKADVIHNHHTKEYKNRFEKIRQKYKNNSAVKDMST